MVCSCVGGRAPVIMSISLYGDKIPLSLLVGLFKKIISCNDICSSGVLVSMWSSCGGGGIGDLLSWCGYAIVVSWGVCVVEGLWYVVVVVHLRLVIVCVAVTEHLVVVVIV